MDSSRSLLYLLIFLIAPCFTFSSYISTNEPHRSTGRFLLQQKSTCRVDVQNMNYTAITSRCKGPNYTSEMCCPPLKELVCPIKYEFNDLNTNCADTFFSYLNLYGKYPPGLFAALCIEDEEGLDCEDVSPGPHQDRAPAAAAAAAAYNSVPLLIGFGLWTLLISYV